MKNKTTLMLAIEVLLLGLASVTNAQQPSPTPTPVDAGDNAGKYTLISTIEIGYRGLQVVGDLNKYQSDLNYKAGPRLFDSSFLLRSKENDTPLFETLLFTTSGWGADPSGNLRISVILFFMAIRS